MRRVLTSGIFIVFCFFTVVILAQVPQLLNYQGRLTDAAGTPITTATTLRFSLYQGGDAATPGSGTLVYQEDASVTPDGNGVFSHLIGSGTVIYGALDSTVFQTADPVYLEITIDPAGANETLLPRKQIVTVGYSFKSEVADDADTVDGEHAAAFAPVGHNHDPDYVNEGQANSVTSGMIVDGTIVDADINASANIAASKIDPTGLDADLLDGKDSLDFVHTSGDDMTGTLSVTTTGATYALYSREQSAIGSTYGVYGRSDSTNGTGVYGFAYAISGSTYGVYGASNSTSGYGLYGTAPNNGIYGLATASSGTTYGLFGQSDSDNGRGVHGYASATSGTNYGVYGISASTSGYGVYGVAPKYGVYGHASGYGVYGEATAPSGTNYGIYGTTNSSSGYGVYGHATATGGITYGVYGKSDSTSARGVYGLAAAESGGTYGVWGQSNSTGGRGVYGTAPTYGVHGKAIATTGINYGVYGQSNSTNGRGVYGTAANYGVYGDATDTDAISFGVYGKSISPAGFGVYGYATAYSAIGVYGEARTFGVYGVANDTSGATCGVFGKSDSSGGHGVFGLNQSGGYAGYFQGKTHVQGTFTATTKSCVQEIEGGKKVLLYAMESPEIWFEDFGTAQLVNGQALVQLEGVFTQAANTEAGYMVFLTPIGEWKGLYISWQDKDAFEVREQGDGTSSISFYYRIVAKRRGYEDVRFEEFTEPEQPSEKANLHMEKK